ncbi:putative acyl-CoA thioester hydrolase [Methylobacterium tardum]|nr:acyl-CoA thioesterase [Methylobacterium tardum]URD36073.1 acyl-CoA thioesterase [Methylobacterium tardum]GJE52369.1 putative acyl-CoA thioester hydrolase [Methylobacterium tardum]
MPRDTNASGAIFGGWTVSQMDLAGGTFVAQRAKGRFVTVSIDAMRFLRPVSVGDEVSVYCTLKEQGDTSLAVKIETWVRDRSGTNPEKVTEGVFTYVALDEDGKPRTLDSTGSQLART